VKRPIAYLAGTGRGVPSHVMTNHDFAAIGIDTSHEWIVERSGIHQRYIAKNGESTCSMGVDAARAAMQRAAVTPGELDAIILSTAAPDRPLPATAVSIQAALGATRAAAFDIAAACSGWLYGLTLAEGMIAAGTAETILVVGSEKMSAILDWTDRTTCVLFGDGAGAIVIQASSEPGVLSSALHADGSYAHILCTPGNVNGGVIAGNAFLHMDGQAVFKLAVNVLEKVAIEALEKADLKPEQIDWLIPHQANIRIMQSTCRKLGLPQERMVVTVGEHGNTSAASIPLAFDVAVRDGRIKRGQNVLIEGVGGGFTWGASVIRY
jgi:3-oxoacyl-[acyl-carrier-protein] synthase III